MSYAKAANMNNDRVNSAEIVQRGWEAVARGDWERVPEGSQLSVLFRFSDGKVAEERWFIDTEQWKAAF